MISALRIESSHDNIGEVGIILGLYTLSTGI